MGRVADRSHCFVARRDQEHGVANRMARRRHGLHARRDYQDRDDPAQRRYLFRLWICPPNGKPLPSAYAKRYGSIEIGGRGGIVCKGTDLTAPLDPI